MSSAHVRSRIVLGLLLAFAALSLSPPTAAVQAPPDTRKTAPNGSSKGSNDAAQIFEAGQRALQENHLDEAERDFRQVLAANPQGGGAYANLGVVYMRRKQWSKALEMLRQAEHLMPQVAGVRLNIGLAYFRQSDFLEAIPPFESVVREQPDAVQPRHLLGLCYFFVERWADASNTLEPLWSQESAKLSYLYVLSIAAHRAGRKEWDERATAQLVKIGEGSAEFHLFMGKAHLNLDQYDLALADFLAAEKANPTLTFVHFNLGLTYLRKQDYEPARDEFLKDVAVEPDLAFDYDELGDVYSLLQQYGEAETNYRKAVRLDPRMLNSYVGLAKIYQRTQNYQKALSAIDSAGKLDPVRPDIHYLRGQILLRLGRAIEGKKELEASVRIDNERRAQRQKQVESGNVPAPELLGEEQ